MLAQINRWTIVLPAWLFRGVVDLGRPSDISLYHLGCFLLVLPSGHSTFREAGAVLQIRVPKCKQHEGKLKANGGSVVDWLDLEKPILAPALSLFCPSRTLAFCMAASWFARGAVSARLLGVQRFGTAKAAPKRYKQADFQHVQPGANCWKVPTAGDVHSILPTLHLLQQRQQTGSISNSNSASSSSGSSDGGTGSDSSGAADESRSSRVCSKGSALAGTSSGGASQPEFWLSHTKPRKPRQGPAARIVLKLRQLSGYDQRQSLQVRQGAGVQAAITLWLSCESAGDPMCLFYAAGLVCVLHVSAALSTQHQCHKVPLCLW
jgi:hypothetical protein